MIRQFISDVSGAEYPENEMISAKNLRETLFQYIQSIHPEITKNSCFSREELNIFREQYMSHYLTQQLGELSNLEKQVVASIIEHTTLAGKLDDEEENTTLSIGD